MIAPLALRPGTAADLSFIMATERLDGYEDLVGRWSEDHHIAALGDGRHAYFVAEAVARPVGFAILRDWDSQERNTLVKRLAVIEPRRGTGTAMTRFVVDAAFTMTDVHRLTIGAFPENLRACRAYERTGFLAEGIARDSVYFSGRFRSELILSILRPEWESRRASSVL